MPEFRQQLELLLADRHSPEGRALGEVLLKYVQRRVQMVARKGFPTTFTFSELEEIIAEVMLHLLKGSLAQFRGNSLPELLGFVRTVSDRCVWRAARRNDRERAVVQAGSQEIVDKYASQQPISQNRVEVRADSPLDAEDQDYLRQLLSAGSKAEHARRRGVSRAAVTQRIKRIRVRVEALPVDDRTTHSVWMRQAARQILDEEGLELELETAL